MSLPNPIIPGKYEMRNGGQAIIAAVAPSDVDVTHPLIGWFQDCDGWQLDNWGSNGSFYIKSEIDEKDLIAPWIDKPEWDWSTTPPWMNWLAMDDGGFWYLYVDKPKLAGSGFKPNVSDYVWFIPKQYAPKWSGDWKDSLVGRHGVEVKP